MLNDFAGADRVYIACGYTDLRLGIDGLAALVKRQFALDPFENCLFLFCGRRRDRIKALYWEGNGFLLLYKNVWSQVFPSGHGKKAKPDRSRHSNTAGSWRD